MFSCWQLINETRLHCALPRFYPLTELLQEAIRTPTATQISAPWRSHPAVAAAILCWPCQGFFQGNRIFSGLCPRVMGVAASLLIGIGRTFKPLGKTALAFLWPVPVRRCTLRGFCVSQLDGAVDGRQSMGGNAYSLLVSTAAYAFIVVQTPSLRFTFHFARRAKSGTGMVS